MATEVPALARPGMVLGPTSHFLAGPGTHVHDGDVVSSLLGNVTVAPAVSNQGGGEAAPKKRLTRIIPAASSASPALRLVSVARRRQAAAVLPEVGDEVLCRVVRLATRQAIVSIQHVGDAVLQTEWPGVIRAQDVRATEKDRVKVQESFRPGDVVRARVISIGDQANYYLSTAANELGVMMATSEAGNDMVPVSWREFRDPETGVGEPRKVAKP